MAVQQDTSPNGGDSLAKGLQSRHVTMLAVGGVIGAGFFLGAGSTINTAGPAVVFSYLFGGLITFLVMVLLTEMAVSTPVAGSFQKYAEMSLGPLPGFLTGWTYWLAFLIGPASESIAAGTFLNVWFPQVPIWVFALIVAALMTIVNLVGVKFFGELEFWLSLIKVVALALFIIGGCVALFGIAPVEHVSFSNLTSNGGFAPAGIGGVVTAMMIVMFSFGGTEAIGTAAEESEHPERDLPKALRSTLARILILFVLSIFVLVCVLPWQKAGVSSSPFVDATRILAGPIAANIMNFVVLIAALSCIDAGIYATSRMMFSMSRDGFFPKVFAKTSSENKGTCECHSCQLSHAVHRRDSVLLLPGFRLHVASFGIRLRIPVRMVDDLSVPAWNASNRFEARRETRLAGARWPPAADRRCSADCCDICRSAVQCLGA